MPLLVNMSFSGSISLVVYLIIERVLRQKINYQWKRKLLICVGICYIIPHQWWTWNIRFLFSKLHENETSSEEIINIVNQFIQITPNGIYAEHMLFFSFIAIGVFLGFSLFVRNMIYYRKIIQYYQKNEQINYVNTLYGKKKIKICKNQYIDTPFVIGIRKPMIIFPAQQLEEEDYKLIVEHELTHVYQHDNIIKMIIYIIVIINFYNPFSYIFYWKWECITEIACDEKVLQNKNEKAIKRYAYLIIHTLEKEQHKVVGTLHFSKDKKMIKERITNMKKENRKSIKRIEGVILILLILMMSSLSALAYNPKQVILTDEEIDDVWENSEVVIDDMSAEMELKDGYWTLITEAGEMEFIPDEEINIEIQVICNHNYIATTFNKHSKKSDGSCKLEIYDGKRCTKCGKVVFGELVNSISYQKCPH